jgi:type I restriction enzyme S subunit
MSSKANTTTPKPDGKLALTPKLRFPAFQDLAGWEETRLGEVASFFKGKGISKAAIATNGRHPCIRYGELYTRYGEVIDEVFSRTDADEADLFFSRSNDVIIPGSGETKLDIATASCVMHDDIALGGDLNVIRTEHNGVFLSYYFNGPKKWDIAKVAQGDTVVHLYPRQLEKLAIALPKPPEQQKIAECLSSVDELMAAQARKLDALKTHKKGLMQQLFPREGETQPRLRFPEFQNAEEWEEKLLGDVVKSFKTGKLDANAMVGNGQYRFYTCAKNYYQIDNYAFEGEALLVAGNGAHLGYIHHYIGKFNAYQRTYVLQKFEANVVFLRCLLERYLPSRILLEKKDGNTPYIVLSTLTEMPLLVPQDTDEQQRIADCLTSLDDLISAQTQKLDALKTHKKGLMQQLFPSPQEVEA